MLRDGLSRFAAPHPCHKGVTCSGIVSGLVPRYHELWSSTKTNKSGFHIRCPVSAEQGLPYSRLWQARAGVWGKLAVTG
eukprot:3045306-Pyramimonas_sp.AAC.1